MPYSGPDAPPTVDISVVAISFSTAAGVSGVAASSFASTAWNPRCMFSPWSPSPISRSSSDSSVRCSAIVAAAPFAHATAHAVSSVT